MSSVNDVYESLLARIRAARDLETQAAREAGRLRSRLVDAEAAEARAIRAARAAEAELMAAATAAGEAFVLSIGRAVLRADHDRTGVFVVSVQDGDVWVQDAAAAPRGVPVVHVHFAAGTVHVAWVSLQRVARLVRDWQRHQHDLRDTAYWQKRFNALEDVLAKTRPSGVVQLFRSEPTNDPEQYRTRFTAWSPSYDAIVGFGWGERRMVSAFFRPESIVVDVGRFSSLDQKDLGVGEVIVRPGNYEVVSWKPGSAPPPRPDAPIHSDETTLRAQLFDAVKSIYGVRPEKEDALREAISRLTLQEVANQIELVEEQRPRTRNAAAYGRT